MELKLRCPLKEVKSTILRASVNAMAGEMIKVGDLIGVVTEDAVNDEFVLVYEAERIVVPKVVADGVSFFPGDNVYYDAVQKAVTNTADGNTLCGKALESVVPAGVEVLIMLKVLA
ncbi:DUF2190 family protein [Candidatus Falkowbacteria bacterium]|nr:DUF2190 family protein [Candidatus Falkowbacteria bacterium]